jgi:copper chaperone CopZ
MRNGIVMVLGVAVLIVTAAVLTAQPPQTATTKISLAELDCAGCLKKVARQLGAVPGVGAVSGELETATMFVAHRPGMNPSPRALWEAVEKADHTPMRLEGPAGVFTQKPQQ